MNYVFGMIRWLDIHLSQKFDRPLSSRNYFFPLSKGFLLHDSRGVGPNKKLRLHMSHQTFLPSKKLWCHYTSGPHLRVSHIMDTYYGKGQIELVTFFVCFATTSTLAHYKQLLDISTSFVTNIIPLRSKLIQRWSSISAVFALFKSYISFEVFKLTDCATSLGSKGL